MSAPAGVTATTLQSGGPGSYTINYSWTTGTTPSAASFSVTLYSIIWGVTSIVKGPTNYTSSQLSDTYTNTVTGASYYCIVTAYAGAGQTGASAQFQSQQTSVYNPYGGPQGVQGYQGVQGLQGPTGPVGQQGLQGVQGLMQVNNYSVANQLVTTAADSVHVNTNPNLTFDGATLTLTGNLTQAGGATLNSGALSGVTTLNASGAIATSAGFTGPSINTNSTTLSRVSGVTLNNGAVSGVTTLGMGGALSGVTTLNASSSIATSAGFTGPSINTDSTSSSRVSGVTLNNGAISGVTTLGMGGALSGVTTLGMGGALSGVTTLNASGSIATSAGFTGPSFSATNFVTAGGGFTGPSSSTINGISIGLTNQNVSGVGTLSCGAITGSSLALGSGGITAAGALSGVTTISNSAAAPITSIGTSTKPVTNIYASTFTGALVGNADTATNVAYSGITGITGSSTFAGNAATATSAGTAGGLTGTPAITVGTISCGAITSTGALGLSANGITSGTHVSATCNTYNLGSSTNTWANVYATSVTGGSLGSSVPAPISGLSVINGASYNPAQIEFHNGAANGGYRHFITTAHSGTADSTGNRIEFWTNNSTTSTGSSAANVSNLNVFTITSGKPAAFTGGQTTSGSVGINKNAPTCALDVNGAIACSNGLHVQGYANGYYNSAPVYGLGFSSTIVNGAAAGAVQLSGYYGLTFATANAFPNAISIDASGRVGINTVSQTYTLDIKGGATSADCVRIQGSNANTGGGRIVFHNSEISKSFTMYGPDGISNFYLYGATSGYIYQPAAIVSGQWSLGSDIRLKNVIGPVVNSTSQLENLNPVHYTMKADPSARQVTGLIAQEVLPYYPNLVSEHTPPNTTDIMYGLDYGGFITPLIAAVKELSARLSNVEAQLART